MVEGPKVVRKARRLNLLVGQSIRNIVQTSNDNIKYQNLYDQLITRVVSIGKELFIVFEKNTIRFHFGMDGSEKIVKCGEDVEISSTNPRRVLSIIVKSTLNDLYFYNTTIQIKSLSYFEIVEMRRDRDIMSKSLDIIGIVAMLHQDDRQICDSIMDQIIIPGVGNIIKCEGLFESKLHPEIITNTLNISQLKLLIQKLQIFAKRWYESIISNKSITYHIYGRHHCLYGHKVTLIRHGIQQRITYYCNICQDHCKPTNSTSTTVPDDNITHKPVPSSSITKNNKRLFSIFNQNQVENRDSSEHNIDNSKTNIWICDRCTFENHDSYGDRSDMYHETSCAMCLSLRQHHQSTTTTTHTTTTYIDNHTSSIPSQQQQLPLPPDQQQNHSLQQHLHLQTPTNPPLPSSIHSITTIPLPPSSIGSYTSNITNTHIPCPITSSCPIKSSLPCSLPLLNPPTCVCKQLTKLQRVRKAGNNSQRLFWSCATTNRNKKPSAPCTFFAWADDMFPKCKHNEITIIRRVLKAGSNNGRYFFICAKMKNCNPCDAFIWTLRHQMFSYCCDFTFHAFSDTNPLYPEYNEGRLALLSLLDHTLGILHYFLGVVIDVSQGNNIKWLSKQ
eukprot:gene11484-24013_t